MAYAEALKHSGVDVDLYLFPGLLRGFAMCPQLSKVIEYHQNTVDWVKKRLQQLWPKDFWPFDISVRILREASMTGRLF